MCMENDFTHPADRGRITDARMNIVSMDFVYELQQNQQLLTEQIIFALSNAVEAKDRYTNGHSQRVANYTQEIVRRMGWNSEQQRKAYYTGLLHDVGKIRVSDAIINKTGPLTDSEYEEIKLHTLAGYYILKEVSAISDFAVGTRWHHERYDGTGYPNGLSEENIPLIARVIGVADAYDAMTSSRSYRKLLPQEYVREEIRRGAGTQFDPHIARIMLEMIQEDTSYQMRQPDTMQKRTILAIDDDPIVLRIVQFALQKEPSYQVVTAASGGEGIEILRREAVDLVLLDVEMPEKNGFDVLAWVRRNCQSLPVIFMTGDKEMEIIQKAEEMGVNDYLTKPLVKHMLLESIHNVLSTSRYVQQNHGWINCRMTGAADNITPEKEGIS